MLVALGLQLSQEAGARQLWRFRETLDEVGFEGLQDASRPGLGRL
ncbi:hypothetical protein [Myxococcus stipitatus]